MGVEMVITLIYAEKYYFASNNAEHLVVCWA